MHDLRTGKVIATGAQDGFASSPALSADGRTLAYTAAPSAGGRPRIVVRDLATGAERAVTDAAEGTILEPQLSADGGVVAYTTVRGSGSAVVRRVLATGEGRVVSRGFATAPSLSADGKLVAYASDATPDGTRGVLLADLRDGSTTLVSRPGAPRAPAGAPASASLQGVTAVPPGPGISILDNAFAAGGHQRPSVTVRRGSVVTWTWRSRQSHNVTTSSGPARFASPTKATGSFRRRMTRAGRYGLVCALHSPGMRMTLVVR